MIEFGHFYQYTLFPRVVNTNFLTWKRPNFLTEHLHRSLWGHSLQPTHQNLAEEIIPVQRCQTRRSWASIFVGYHKGSRKNKARAERPHTPLSHLESEAAHMVPWSSKLLLIEIFWAPLSSFLLLCLVWGSTAPQYLSYSRYIWNIK